jgi:hypothetical protein
MSLQTLAFLLGCGLIVIAIVGGGIEAKEVKVPQLSPIPRILSAFFGIGLVVGAVGGLSGFANWGNEVSDSNAAEAAAANALAAATPVVALPLVGNATEMNSVGPAVVEPPPPPPPPPGTRSATLTDSLGPGQEYERIQVFVGGRQVGLIALDVNNHNQSITVEIHPGVEYTLVGTEASRDEEGLHTRTIRGSGTFDSSEDTNYTFQLVGRSAELTDATIVPR